VIDGVDRAIVSVDRRVVDRVIGGADRGSRIVGWWLVAAEKKVEAAAGLDPKATSDEPRAMGDRRPTIHAPRPTIHGAASNDPSRRRSTSDVRRPAIDVRRPAIDAHAYRTCTRSNGRSAECCAES
jgi:hypothetical protein